MPRPRSGRARYLDIEFADGRVGATADADRPVATPTGAAGGQRAEGAAPKRVASRPAREVCFSQPHRYARA